MMTLNTKDAITMTGAKPFNFLTLNYESALEDLGSEYYDRVQAAAFPQHILRFRNNQLLSVLGLDSQLVKDQDFIDAFGLFEGVRPFLALRYHGYQFGEYNRYLGDGRGFLYGQVWGQDNSLYDLGTKGSGKTPYSRGGDGRLTLKGGVREVLAAEALQQLGVSTSRCLSLIETGESLWRGDEPSPTRSSVMVRLSKSHIRFGTFERLSYIKRKDLIEKLLDHVINYYYPGIAASEDRYAKFYAELVERVATLAAQWMAAGFCHGVLNTDNMSITGESFDYGPYAFIPTYNPRFTAAYFDYGARYCYANQPGICRLNLEMLQVPLSMVMSASDLEAGLSKFDSYYHSAYSQLMLRKLGLEKLPQELGKGLLRQTVRALEDSQVKYHGFFAHLAQEFNFSWRKDEQFILRDAPFPASDWDSWRNFYHRALNTLPEAEMAKVKECLIEQNPHTALLRPTIESVWKPIAEDDNWEPFYELLRIIWAKE